MIVFPNAKINIGLEIERKRSDGYHDIATIMVPVGWTDALEVIESDKHGVHLSISGNPVDCPMEKNLVIKALRAVERYAGRKFNVEIFLKKIVPDGAGLGGGSADAAFMVRLLDQEFRLGLSDGEMKEIVASVGSDCPFFIDNRPVYAHGRGELMEPVELPLNGWYVLIVKPLQSISTAQAYGGVEPKVAEVDLREAIRQSVEKWRNLIYNRFEPVVFSYYPEMRQIKNELYNCGAVYASMSGSGSAFYGLFAPTTDNMADICRRFVGKGLQVFHERLTF